jgi:hypothetical protein
MYTCIKTLLGTPLICKYFMFYVPVKDNNNFENTVSMVGMF